MLKLYWQNRKEWGFKYLPAYLFWEGLKKLGVVFCQVSTNGGSIDPLPPVEIPSDYTIKRLPVEELGAYVDSDAPLTQTFVDEAAKRGDLCTAVFCQDELVAFIFLTTTLAPATDQLDLVIPKKFRYSYKAWVHKAHRRRHLSQAVATEMFLYAEDVYGIIRSIWYIEKGNFPSRMRGYRYPSQRGLKMGFVGWFTWFGKQIPFNSRTAKWLGVKMVRRGEAKPYLYLH